MQSSCSTHATAGMVDVRGRNCKHEGCSTRSTYGVPGTKKAELCSKHVRAGMVNVFTRRCLQPRCNITFRMVYKARQQPSANFCAQHAMGGMVNLRSKSCIHPGCKVTASFGEKGSQARKFCAQHACDDMTNKILSPSFRRQTQGTRSCFSRRKCRRQHHAIICYRAEHRGRGFGRKHLHESHARSRCCRG